MGTGTISAGTISVLIAAIVGCGAFPMHALAQSGTGVERYEVTITPPKRPGSEPAADASPVESAPAGAEAANADPAASAPTGDEASKQGGAPDAPAAQHASVVPPAPGLPVGPLRTLQVGAFRQQKSAVSLQDALAESFPDVAVIEAQSGGESIYRVNVGRLPRGPALDDLKRKLVAAGYPTFELLAPATESAAN